MARTIAELAAGTLIYLDETQNTKKKHTPYIYLGLDESGNARLLRQYYANNTLRMRINDSDASYGGSNIDTWMENEENGFLKRFDTAIIDALVPTSIEYADYHVPATNGPVAVVAINRRCFLLSASEVSIDNPNAWEGKSYLPALKAFTGKQDDAEARRGHTEEGYLIQQWLRSAYDAERFYGVSAYGNWTTIRAGTTGPLPYVRPALSITPTTPVSEEGAPAIFLLPEGRDPHWYIQAHMSLGKAEKRPMRCKLITQEDEFEEIQYQVCNNYGDEAPTWTPCASGGTALLGTDKTAEDWELGVQVYAKSEKGELTIGEPAVIVECEEEEEA